MTITQAQLKELLHYNPDTGVFTWSAPRIGVRAGSIAGAHHNQGYTHICVLGKKILAHRLAWFYIYGEWPEQDTDHINGNKKDNRIANLRSATRAQNKANVSTISSNTSGVKNVHWDTRIGKWIAKICVSGKSHAKIFENIEHAKEWVAETRKNLHGQFANHG